MLQNVEQYRRGRSAPVVGLAGGWAQTWQQAGGDDGGEVGEQLVDGWELLGHWVVVGSASVVAEELGERGAEVGEALPAAGAGQGEVSLQW